MHVMLSFLRYMYFNFYAFLLIAMGAGIFFLPFSVFVFILRVVLSACLVSAAFAILKTWNRKKRVIKLLLAKNEKEFAINSFKPFMSELCMQLIVIYVLCKKGKLRLFLQLLCGERKK